MQSPSAPHNIIPLRSPTPTLDLNDLDQELARLDDTETKRPHFLDYDPSPPPDLDSIQHPIQPRATDVLTNGAPHTNGIAISDARVSISTKKHFLDENPIPPDYDYERRHHRSLDREHDRSGRNKIYNPQYERRHSIERPKQRKEPTELSRFLDTKDDRMNDVGAHPELLLDKNNEYVAENYEDASAARLGTKVNRVYSLLDMIGNRSAFELSGKFLEHSKLPGTCTTLRGSIPWLVGVIHTETDELTRKQARQALHNVVHQQDDKAGRREAKVLRHIEQIMDYCDAQKQNQNVGPQNNDSDSHPFQAMHSLMKVSFDQDHRYVMCQLGALQTIAELVQCDHAVHGADSTDQKCFSLRRYAGMALTNLTFGDGNNKALLCANKDFMKALVAQIATDADDLLQVTAHVLRNLSWRPGKDMKTVLSGIGAVKALTKAAMKNKNENTLRAVMSALWNLTANKDNKEELLAVDGALAFLVEMLTYDAPSKTLSIVENAGGILSNVSSHIAVNEDFRRILRQRNCLGILLQQLKSASLTIVSNACGTLWNLSARCPEDQKYLRENGAVPMLRSLIHSKHKMISIGSKTALKNLIVKGGEMSRSNPDPVAKMIGLKELPTLNVRKQRALEQELSETNENIGDKTPSSDDKSISDSIRNRKPKEPNNNITGVDHSSIQISVVSDKDRNTRMPSKPTLTATEERKSITGTIPKRLAKHHSNEDADIDRLSNVSNASSASSAASSSGTAEKDKSKGKHPETDLDQITNFALLDDENHHGNKIVVGDDSTQCYEIEGTPHTVLSSAASVSELWVPPRQSHVAGMNKRLKNDRNTIDNSGINTPEKPIYYCEEGTPMCFSHHDSFSSLDEEHPQNEHDIVKTQPRPPPTKDDHADVSAFVPNSIGGDTVPTSPGGETAEAASKSVKFNEFLETPMMFSRQSSMESLSSIEPAMADDRSSVVSEISRMPSGIISPSEFPDSPSQSMPQSPRRRRRAAETPSPPLIVDHASGIVATNSLRHLPFEEEQVKTYVVENTPAHISCATSLSNLSLDEETKITTDCLLKEMRLMHQLSDEQDEMAAASATSTLSTQTENDEANTQKTSHNDVPSDSDDSVNDSLLLATCINIGMKGASAGPRTLYSDKIAAPPLMLPLKLPRKVLSTSDEDEDADDDLLLQKCIRDGKQAANTSTSANGKIGPLPRLPNHAPLENAIGMLRKGGNAYIDCIPDRPNRFNVEDSPCNFSVVSGLSELTIATNTPAAFNTHRLSSTQENAERSLSPTSVDSEEDRILLNQAIAAGMQSTAVNSYSRMPGRLQQASTSNPQPIPTMRDPTYIDSNHSLSSNDSNVNDDEVLQQAIKLGMTQKPPVSIQPKPPVQQQRHSQWRPFKATDHRSARDADDDAVSNHSCSSIGSHDSNVNDEQILQYVIKVGMGQQTATSNPPKPPVQQHQLQQRRSQLPLFKASGPAVHRQSRERKDEQLLLNGIERNRNHSNENTPPPLPLRSTHLSTNVHQHRGPSGDSQNKDHSKNAYTTSAAVLGTAGATSMVTDVVMSHQEGTITDSERDQRRPAALPMVGKVIVDRTPETPAQHEIGYSVCFSTASALNASFVSTKSHGSFHSGLGSALLEQSNEYPAIFGTNDAISDISDNSPSMDMDVSNEFLFEQLSPMKMDKHKDPDLMLQSVERLTYDFVSTAEYLRTAKVLDCDDDDDDSTLAEDKKSSFSTSHNTWNDDVNDVSFPSISRSAPVIASMKDDDTSNSGSNHGIKHDAMTNAEPSEEPTPTNEFKTIIGNTADNGKQLHFDIGGEINQLNFTDIGPNYIYSSSVNSFDTNSTMTNSTIIAMEANKIRTELMINGNGDRSDSTISLDKIRPPSAMDKLSSCEPLSNGPSSLKTSGKFLTQGFMARRALTNGTSAHGSMDSINSSCNLDRVKPPSLMDELLDSMISVDSIASEFVDAPMHHEEPSHYETAHSECDDMTMTLKNCAELPIDSTPCGSDFSSVESTPKKTRRSLTPRRKRQLTRDRYQTYTIAKETSDEPQSFNSADDSQSLTIHDAENTLVLNDDSDAISLVSTDDGEMSSIRALTRKLKYLQDVNTNTYTKKSTERFTDLSKTSSFRPELAEPKPNLPLTTEQSGSLQQPNTSIAVKSPRIVIPSYHDGRENSVHNEQKDVGESKAIRGRKKPTYVSPYKMTKLAKPAAKPVSPPVVKSVTPLSLHKSLSPRITPAATKSPALKSPEPTKTSSPSIARAKSLIQRSAESLRKIRPAIASKLTKQNSLSPTTTTAPRSSPEDKFKLSRQKSDDTAHSSGTSTLIRQNTFTKDEPSAIEIPVISSEPSSPKKTSKIATKIPFNRSVSAAGQRNVTKCKTNIEIPLQKSAANIKRNMKSATSASHIMSPASSLSSTPKQSPRVEQRSIVGDAVAGKNIFKRFSPLQKSNTLVQSKSPLVNAKVKSELKSSAPNTSIPFKSKIATGRISYATK